MAPSPYERRPAVHAPGQRSKASKRIRGEIACAECRRLKIRCDKIVPCSTCVQRFASISAIEPLSLTYTVAVGLFVQMIDTTGTIPPGEGSRFVLAATDHLRHKLSRMQERKTALEDALAILHSSNSNKPHPLLAALDTDDESAEDDDVPESTLHLRPVPEDDSSLVESLGSLHIDQDGGSRFFGPAGGAESLLLKAKGLEASFVPKSAPLSLRELDPSYLPPEINQFVTFFPFTPPGIPHNPVKEMIEAFLPPIDRAIFLCETFLEHLSWMFHIVSRRQLIEELIPAIYHQNGVLVDYGPHELAVLLVTLGIGALVDLNMQPYNLEAQHYYRLARAALGLQSILTKPSVVTVKTLHLMSIYNGMSGKEANLEASYINLDLATQVALRTGLHIDPSMWGFSGREAYERRVYFWNLLIAVLWQSLITGRPPSILQVYVDCKIPTEEEEALFNGGGPPIGLGIWGHHISQSVLLLIVRATLGVKPPNYNAVLDLDAKIRTLARPDPTLGEDRTAVAMNNFVRGHYLDLASLFLHRSYFAQAMMSHTSSPLSSPYSLSVFAAYKSACNVLIHTLKQFTKNPGIVARVWRIWSFAFTAAVVVGTMAIRGSRLETGNGGRKLEPEPWPVFQTACGMFREAAQTNSRAARALPVLQGMLVKAYQARHTQTYAGEPPTIFPDDEIAVFGGRAKPVVRSRSPPLATPTPVSTHHQPLQQETGSRQAILHTSPVTAFSSTSHQLQTSSPLHPSLETLAYDSAPLRATQQYSWEGLFREAPDPVQHGLQTHGIQPSIYYTNNGMTSNGGSNQTIDDRWSSLMHSYGLLDMDVEEQEIGPQDGAV
ncbi:Fungal-trans domain-containing protein [Mycena indigotica]|uniref:Fungal-trans domain-containing protein n=1 Tax=Mycena indigotica TaxID=2126181 RepID=A0A8H6S521_9AGAR|nr:Fungal-trans domain-containing protein [Mycena indigotica]KAF7292903.1 Fungal-trans domain-containing protein [Mycena indigotica]